MGKPDLRITGVRATPVAVPFTHPEVWAFGVRHGMVSVVIEVDTADGLVGIGEAAAYPSADIVLAVLASIDPLVGGESAYDIERIMKRINVVGTWHHVKATSPAIAGIEMACWDLVGKAADQPLVNLFGGRVRDRVDYFYYLSRQSPERMAADAAAGAEQGFRTVYLKIGADDPGEDIERVEAIRAAIGPDVGIRVDANEAWSSSAAITVLTEMEKFGLELAEQPVSGRNLDEMAYVRSRISVPLLANEASWTRQDQLDVIRHRAADVVSIDNQMDGGLGNLKLGAGLCELAGIPVLKHSLGELGIATYAGAQLLASIPNAIHPSQAYGSLLADDVVAGVDTLPYVGGALEVPDAPGIGVELDRDKLDRYGQEYARSAAEYAFHEEGALRRTPLMPKF